MDNVDLLEKLYQQQDLIKSELDKAMQLRADLIEIFRNSQEKISVVSLREPKNFEEITELKEQLKGLQHSYTTCKLYIIKYQADSIATELNIKRIERGMQKILNKKGFFKIYSKDNNDPDNGESKILHSDCASCHGRVNFR